MEDTYFVNNVIELYKQKEWLEICEKYHDYPGKQKLLWVYPSRENVEFLQKHLSELKCDSILSIGCGSGLLEWMISEGTGLPIQGIEVDGAWWGCKYAPPTFIPLLLTSPTLHEDLDTIEVLKRAHSAAILFCYFNDRAAFEEYLKYFTGSVLVIIGPGEGKAVHTEPRPFDAVNDDWRLHAWQEVRTSKDFIAVYSKHVCNGD